MTDLQEQRQTLKEWLSEHARSEPMHYKKIAKALERDPASVAASFSIERKQARDEKRPAYFVKDGPGLYRYNDLCEGYIDAESIKEISDRVDDFNKATRKDIQYELARLDLQEFEELVKIILRNIRTRDQDTSVIKRTSNSIIFVTSWLNDSGQSRVVVYAKKCPLDEHVHEDVISEIRGALPINEANQGILITNGVVTDNAKREALGFRTDESKVFVPPVHLMDIDILLNILFQYRIGIISKNVELLLLDHEFFNQLDSG